MRNPLQEYNSIIHLRQQNPLPEGQYGEKHHIIPRSCGGTDDKWNLVRLAPEEHYRCHQLLPLVYATGPEHQAMVYACWMLTHINGVKIPVEEYARLKAEKAKIHSDRFRGTHPSAETLKKLSESHKGKPNPRKGKPGKKHTDEWKRNQSKMKMGKKHGPMSDEQKSKLSKAHQGKHASEETRRKMSEARKGKHLSESAKRKVSEAHKGKPSWAKGHKWSEETKQKMSHARKKWWANRKAQQ